MPAKGYSGTKYTKSMPEQLIEMFSRGKDRCHFCSYHSISENTFSEWLRIHPEFDIAYKIAQAKAKEWYMELAQKYLVEQHEGDKLNTKLWSMIMRNRFDLTEHRKIKMAALKEAKTFTDQMRVVLDELAEGNITASEAREMSKLIEAGVAVFEATELERRVAEIEKAQRTGFGEEEFKEVKDS